MSHTRVEVKEGLHPSLEKVIVEQRGTRNYVLQIYHDPRVTLLEAMLTPSPEDKYAELFEYAHEILKAAGEKTLLEVLKEFEADEDGADEKVYSGELTYWATEIGQRRGYLSVEHLAAKFLAASDTLHMTLRKGELTLTAIYAFCDAWHGLSSEITGEHALASAGLNAERGRQMGKPARAAKGAARAAIVKDKYLAYRGRERRRTHRSMKVAAAAILGEVNKELAANGLGSYTEGSLRKILGKIAKQ
jgi:hypothetical protein